MTNQLEDILKLKKDGGKAADIIIEALALNNIVFGVGMDAIQCVYAYMSKENHITYKEYCSSMDSMKKGYKKLWDEK